MVGADYAKGPSTRWASSSSRTCAAIRLALRDQDLRLAQVADNLLCGITLSGHDDPGLLPSSPPRSGRVKTYPRYLYGQEINAETYAICKADLLLKGEGEAADNIVGGPEHSTLANDALNELIR